MHWLFLLLLTFPGMLASALEINLTTGFHVESFKSSLKKSNDNFAEHFGQLNHQMQAPELRLSINYLALCHLSLEASLGALLERPSSGRFSCRYLEESGSKAFSRRRKGSLSGYDYSAAAAYTINLYPHIALAPLVGYSGAERHSHCHPKGLNTGQSTLLNSHRVRLASLKVSGHWQGPWAGLRFAAHLSKRAKFFIEGQYHVSFLHTHEHGNIFEKLPDNFLFTNAIKLFRRGKALGYKINLLFSYSICPQWDFTLNAYYEKLTKVHGQTSHNHYQKLFSPKGKVLAQNHIAEQPKYHFEWHAWAILLGVGCVF